MDLRKLRYFSVVAEELHFGRAAARLHMAQPPLSQQIRRLEAELGVDLFDRSTRRVALTDAGRLLQSEAKEVLSRSDALERRMTQFREGEGGILRLGFVDSSSYEVMPRFLRSYRERWPDVDYELRSMSSDEQHEALRSLEIDLGIGRAPGPGSEVDTTPFLTEPLFVAVGEGHRLSKQQSTKLSRLKREEFIGFDRSVSPTLHRELTQLFAGARLDYDPIIEATEYTTVLGLVASGQGIAVVPASVRTFQPPAIRYLKLNDADATSNLIMLSRKGEASALVSHALALVAELF